MFLSVTVFFPVTVYLYTPGVKICAPRATDFRSDNSRKITKSFFRALSTKICDAVVPQLLLRSPLLLKFTADVAAPFAAAAAAAVIAANMLLTNCAAAAVTNLLKLTAAAAAAVASAAVTALQSHVVCCCRSC